MAEVYSLTDIRAARTAFVSDTPQQAHAAGQRRRAQARAEADAANDTADDVVADGQSLPLRTPFAYCPEPDTFDPRAEQRTPLWQWLALAAVIVAAAARIPGLSL
jgi:hypothetical protein